MITSLFIYRYLIHPPSKFSTIEKNLCGDRQGMRGVL